MDIVVCTDKNFVMPTGVMMYSVCKNSVAGGATFHIIVDKSVTKQDRNDLSDICLQFNDKALFYEIDENSLGELPALETRKDITKATYYRLWLPLLLPESLDKVLYLDGDIIVRDSLDVLYDTDISDHPIGAIPFSHPSYEEECNRLGYSKSLGYFNAGVLLINLAYWRKHNVISKFLEFMNDHPDRIMWHDQDVLNYVFAGESLWLPYKYNITGGLLSKELYNKIEVKSDLLEAIKNPTIVHFTMSKPWQTMCSHPYRSIFFKYQSQTIWKDAPLQETRPVKLRIIKFFSGILRRLKLIPELPPYNKGYMDGLSPLD